MLLAYAHRPSVLLALFSAHLFFSFHVFLTVYINSTYLATFIDESVVGLVFMAASILSLAGLYVISRLLERFGNYWLVLWFAVTEVAVMLGMAALPYAISVVPLFILMVSLTQLIFYHMDIFLETYTTNEHSTGSIRGSFLTIANVAQIVSPLIAGMIIINNEYWRVYILAAVLLIPFIWIVENATHNFQDPVYRSFNFAKTVRKVLHSKDLLGVFALQFLLRLFYSWAVIYIPIYLIQHLGFTWTHFGVILSIGLLPFGLLSYALGWLADTIMGEKELLITGILIISVSLLFFSIVTTASILIWTTLMFMSRTGAAMVDVLTDSYFFKHVKNDSANLISIYRMARPFAYLIGPAIGSIALLLFDFRYTFIVLAVIMLSGVFFAARIKDTR